ALDPVTGRLFCGAQTALVSFDTRAGKTSRIYGERERPPENHHYDHWQLSDGSFGFIFETPGLSYLRWDPSEETVSWKRLTEDEAHPTLGLVRKLNYVENGRVYLPHFGWFDGLTGEFEPHDHPPDEEACWLGRTGDRVVGIQYDAQSISSRFISWDVATGKTSMLFTAADTPIMNCSLTESGKIVLVDVYGMFRRYHAQTGELELTRQIEPTNAHLCNVILPVGDHRVVGTPFIAQNFWSFDTRDHVGFYGGRGAGSLGQIDYAVEVDHKVYFAVYGGGQLTKYDPERPPGFPRNPHLVAQNEQGQHGAGITTDGRIIWAAFKPRYGSLDGALIRYDTRSGEATYQNKALPGRHLLNPIYDAESGHLVAGSSYLSDCETAEPHHNRPCAVTLDAKTMTVVKMAQGPVAGETLLNYGPLSDGLWLMACKKEFFTYAAAGGILTPYPSCPADLASAEKIAYAGRPGHFLWQIGTDLFLWRAQADDRVKVAEWPDGSVKRWWCHGNHLTFDCGLRAAIWRDFLTQ
ncbi:MAG: hypothetical protein O3B73_05815, partial [bacterium]|nr:hypothetical protein [bacterium]